MMSKKIPKTQVVAFKVEEELAGFLNGLPNKSDFIRRAIYSQFGLVCPLCRGVGSVSKEKHDHFESFLKKWDLHQCGSCGDEFALPKDIEGLPESIRSVILPDVGEEVCFSCVGKRDGEAL
jgi:hypothetical protein